MSTDLQSELSLFIITVQKCDLLQIVLLVFCSLSDLPEERFSLTWLPLTLGAFKRS